MTLFSNVCVWNVKRRCCVVKTFRDVAPRARARARARGRAGARAEGEPTALSDAELGTKRTPQGRFQICRVAVSGRRHRGCQVGNERDQSWGGGEAPAPSRQAEGTGAESESERERENGDGRTNKSWGYIGEGGTGPSGVWERSKTDKRLRESARGLGRSARSRSNVKSKAGGKGGSREESQVAEESRWATQRNSLIRVDPSEERRRERKKTKGKRGLEKGGKEKRVEAGRHRGKVRKWVVCGGMCVWERAGEGGRGKGRGEG